MPLPLTGVLTRYRPTATTTPKRKPGRPRKRNSEYFKSLMEAHRQVLAWFVAERGGPPSSDRELYTEYFANQFVANGERAGRASSADFQRALKTLRNELSEARQLERSNPENGVILGTGDPVKC